jgi:hypothetical protein
MVPMKNNSKSPKPGYVMILMGIGMALVLLNPPTSSPWDILAIIIWYPGFAFMMGYSYRVYQEKRRS